jgi:uncharacterized membrane protein
MGVDAWGLGGTARSETDRRGCAARSEIDRRSCAVYFVSGKASDDRCEGVYGGYMAEQMEEADAARSEIDKQGRAWRLC